MFSRLLTWSAKHKFTAGILFLAIAGGGYWGYTKIFNDDGLVRYAIAQVEKGTLAVSVSGSGQVAALNQLNITPKASGEVVWVGVGNGQEVKAGTLIAQLDTREAQKTVRDAEANLESARLSLQRTREQTDVAESYEDAFDTLAAFFGQATMLRLDAVKKIFEVGEREESHAVYYRRVVATYQPSFSFGSVGAADEYQRRFQRMRDAYALYLAARRGEHRSIDEAVAVVSAAAESFSDLVRQTRDLVQDYKQTLAEESLTPDWISVETTDGELAQLNDLLFIFDQHLLGLRRARDAVQDVRGVIAGADLDIQSARLAVRQREDALEDAREKLADYFVRAPFDGVIARLGVKKGDSVSTVTILGALITRQKIAEISLNEVDAAGIAVGQKAALVFDAIPDLTLAGQVVEVDAVGVVSQGVVTYVVKLSLEASDERVKPSMSVTATIVVDEKADVLLVPASAVKTQGGRHYVEIIEGGGILTGLAASVGGAILEGSPVRRPVEIGLTNDEFTEVAGGLQAGDLVVTRAIQGNSSSLDVSRQQGGFRLPGFQGGAR